MRTLAGMITAMALLAGCAALEEAYYVDREFGLAQQTAWDTLVAYPDYRHVAKTPEGIEGVYAERIMGAGGETFAKEPECMGAFQPGMPK